MFAQAVYVGNQQWDLKGSSEILVTHSEELNIIVPANDKNPATYVDVPFGSILEVLFDTIATESPQPTYGLVIQLTGEAATNCIVNAVGYVARHVALAFASEKDANTLHRLLKQTGLRINGSLPQVVSQSEAIDVSQPSLSDDELALASSDSQIIIDTGALPGAITPHSHAVSTINLATLERSQTSQRASAEYQEEPLNPRVKHDEDPQWATHDLDMAEEGFEVSQIGSLVRQSDHIIDISQKEGLSREGSQHREIKGRVSHEASSNAHVQDSQILENRTLEPISQSHRISDTGRSSSQQGLSAFQNAPRSRVQLPHPAVSSVKPVEADNRPKIQNEEHDDLYDASPRVKDGPRRSPRLIARANIHQNIKRPMESPAPQASVKTGPHTKLSRQLRNAGGVVESHTEQTVDNDRATSTSNDAGEVRTYANTKKSKTPAPAKTQNVVKQSSKPTKKAARTKGKAVATTEPPNASLEDFDLPPSPTSMDPPVHAFGKIKKENKARTTQSGVTKAPRNNQKQVKPLTANAATMNSSKGSAAPVKKSPMNKAEANASIHDSLHNTPHGKKIDDDDAAGNVNQAQSEEIPQASRQSRQPANAASRQEVRASKTDKIKVKAQLPSNHARPKQASKAQIQAPVARTLKAKPAPAAMSQPRSQRAAAIKANKKIEGVDKSDEIVDGEDFVPALMPSKQHASSDAAKAPKKQEVKDSKHGSDDRSAFKQMLPAARSLMKDSIPDSMSPSLSEIQKPDSASDTKAGSNPEKVNIVEGITVEALEAAPGDTGNSWAEESLTGAAVASMILLDSGNADESNQPDNTSAHKDVGVSEPRVDSVPPSVPQPHEYLTETEQAHTRPHRNDLDGTRSADSRDQVQVEHDLPVTDDVSHELDLEPDKIEEEVILPQAPAAKMVDQVRGRRTSPSLALKAQGSQVAPNATRRDPFTEKLNALISRQTELSPNIKRRGDFKDSKVKSGRPNAHKGAGLVTPSREPEERGRDEVDAMSFEGPKQAENPQRHLNTAMQLDGGVKRSLTETLKSNGESRSASGVEAKRKMEQDGSTSHKRVRLAPQEVLEVSAIRRPVHHSKKTPPPVVSNKPLVIGFSSTGPKNQGTSSTKKSKPPKNVSTAAPTVGDSRRHSIPNPTTNQVEVGFPSVQEALDITSEHTQHDPKVAAGAGNSPERTHAANLTKATTAVTRQAISSEHSSQKRKLAPFLDDPAPWEQEEVRKRQKRDIDTPPPVHQHRPKMLPDLSPVVFHDRSQQLSSQNTRVNENGSPMPFMIARNECIAEEGRFSDEDDGMDALAEAELQEYTVLQKDDPVLPEPGLPHRPLLPTLPISQSKLTAYQSLSNNSKQVPSSPHAPSAYGTLPPHHIYHDGEIVNVKTKESIIPSMPQDPFLGATDNSKNPFMDALRRSTEGVTQRLATGVNDKNRSGGMSMRSSFIRGEDPDKTLVEPKVRRKYKQVVVSDSSSSLQSGSSIQESESDEPSEEESDRETEARWRKALEPHQEHMLECLLTISHVSKASQNLLAALIQSSAFDSTSSRQRNSNHGHGQ